MVSVVGYPVLLVFRIGEECGCYHTSMCDLPSGILSRGAIGRVLTVESDTRGRELGSMGAERAYA